MPKIALLCHKCHSVACKLMHPPELEIRRLPSFQLLTILEENHHSFLIVEHDPLLYEDAEKRMMEYQVEAKMPWAQRMLEATG